MFISGNATDLWSLFPEIECPHLRSLPQEMEPRTHRCHAKESKWPCRLYGVTQNFLFISESKIQLSERFEKLYIFINAGYLNKCVKS